MPELGIPYEIVSPDGQRIVFGNCDEAVADPDFIGFLDPDNGITGLLDGADVRENFSDLVERDGSQPGPAFLGRRAGGFLGRLRDSPTPHLLETKVKRAHRALRADGFLRWTPKGEGLQRELRVRRQAKPIFSGRLPKTWQIALSSGQPYALSAVEDSTVIVSGSPASELGIPDPFPDPMTSAIGATAQATIINLGDAPTWPRFRIDGPITNPVLLNNTTGQQIRLIRELAAGEFITINASTASVLFGGIQDEYDSVDFDVTDWWQLEDGPNDVRLLALSFSTGAQLTVFFRHAYE